MASDLFVFDNFFSDSFSTFIDTAIDSSTHEIYQTFQESLHSSSSSSNNNNNNTIIQESSVDGGVTNSLDHIVSELLASSPPSHELESLSLYHITNQSFPNASDFSAMEVKTEEYQIPFETITGFGNSFMLQGCGSTTHNAEKMMQRSYSSNSFEGKPSFMFQPHLDGVLESPNLQAQQVLSSPETNFSTGQMRRACSTGDLQKMKTTQTRNVLSSSPLSTEGSLMEEPNFKVGRYSAEERKERIHRYRAKRTQRNFNKTIKYACRKTLADNRPRIRGRFARNDEAVEIPKTAMFNRYEDEDDLWIDGYHEEDEEGSLGRAPFYNNSYSSTTPQYQYYSY